MRAREVAGYWIGLAVGRRVAGVDPRSGTGSVRRYVPPTAVASGSEAGQPTVGKGTVVGVTSPDFRASRSGVGSRRGARFCARGSARPSIGDSFEHLLEHLPCALCLLLTVEKVGVDAEGDLTGVWPSWQESRRFEEASDLLGVGTGRSYLETRGRSLRSSLLTGLDSIRPRRTACPKILESEVRVATIVVPE